MTMAEPTVRDQVQQFYERVGWRPIGEGAYQNVRYEDVRPVSADYVRHAHLRVSRHLPTKGKYLLDAGSGPIQYPEYLEYSAGFDYRVCLDLSRRGLEGARLRLGGQGLYVVGDLARLPFRPEAFAGVVSLHALHHLPPSEQEAACRGLDQVLAAGGRAVVVYSWGARSGLMRMARPLVRAAEGLRKLRRSWSDRRGRVSPVEPEPVSFAADFAATNGSAAARAWRADRLDPAAELLRQPGTYTHHHDYDWFVRTLADLPGFEVRVWRSVSVQFLRALIHPRLLGRTLLRGLTWLEDRFPRALGRHGQYPMILFSRPAGGGGR
jgi:hypothetical protein